MSDIEFNCRNVDITPVHGYNINVIATDADIDELVLDTLSSLDPKDIVYNCDIDELLDAIGVEKCKDYFDLEEIDERVE